MYSLVNTNCNPSVFLPFSFPLPFSSLPFVFPLLLPPFLIPFIHSAFLYWPGWSLILPTLVSQLRPGMRPTR